VIAFFVSVALLEFGHWQVDPSWRGSVQVLTVEGRLDLSLRTLPVFPLAALVLVSD